VYTQQDRHQSLFDSVVFVISRTWHTTVSPFEEQVIIKFCVHLDKTFSQSYNVSREAYGNKAMGQSAVHIQFRHFRERQRQSQSHITTDDQSVSASWFRAPSGVHDQKRSLDPGYIAWEQTAEKTPPRNRPQRNTHLLPPLHHSNAAVTFTNLCGVNYELLTRSNYRAPLPL
jgi:hypothetical protein